MAEQKPMMKGAALNVETDTRTHGQKMLQCAKVIGYGSAMIMTSAGLIAFNKHLVSGGFPYPCQLVMQHAAFSTLVSSLLFALKPSLFPKLTDPLVRITVDRHLFVWGVLPIAVLFAGHLVLSNTAYLYSTVPFLQMLKESNIVVTYILSCIAALETLNKSSAFLIVLIVCATGATIHGEIHFSLAGLIIQGTSIFCESGKAVLQNIILSNTGRKLDPMSYVLLVSPVCFSILAVVLTMFHLAGSSYIKYSGRDVVHSMFPILLLNASVAYLLNVLMAAFVHASSAMSFVICGILKDVMIVLAGVMFLKEAISGQQAVAFTAQIILIAIWATMKMFPKEFEDGIIPGVRNLIKSARGSKSSQVDDGKVEGKDTA